MSTVFEKEIGNEFGIYHRIGQDKDKKVIHALHAHSHYELIYILKGTAIYQIEDKHFEASSGTLVVINSRAFHSITPTNSTEYDRIVLQIDKKFLTLLGLPYNFFNAFEIATNSASFMILPQVMKQFNLDKHFEILLTLAKSALDINEVRLRCQLPLFLLDLAEASQKTEVAQPVFHDEKIKKTIDYINNNLSKPISLDELAKNIYVSKFYLSHIFKEYTGLSIHSYIQRKKILTANDLIRDGKTAIEASLAVGYNNYSNFYKTFNNIMGKSPKKQ